MIYKKLIAISLTIVMLLGALVIIIPESTEATLTTVIYDDMEAGNLNKWTDVTGYTLSTDYSVSASHAAKGTTQGGVLFKSELSWTFPRQFDVSFYINSMAASKYIDILYLSDNSGNEGGPHIRVYTDSNGLFTLASKVSTVTTICNTTGNAWHHLYINATANNAYKIWYDGSPQGTYTGNSASSTETRMLIGNLPYTDMTVYFDDIYVYTGNTDPVDVSYWAPTFSSSAITTGLKNVLYSYHITLNETGTVTYKGAPSWLTISNTKNGTTGPWYLNGTPSSNGVFSLHLEGYSTAGTQKAYQNYTLTVSLTWAPTFTNSPLITGIRDAVYSYSPAINCTGTFTSHTKPNWASWSGTGYSGTPTVNGNYDFKLYATSTTGTLDTWKNWTLTITSYWQPIITSTPLTVMLINVGYYYNITANESCTFTLTTKPAWANFTSPAISGVPIVSGIYQFILEANSTNGHLPTYQYWNLTVSNSTGLIVGDNIIFTPDTPNCWTTIIIGNDIWVVYSKNTGGIYRSVGAINRNILTIDFDAPTLILADNAYEIESYKIGGGAVIVYCGSGSQDYIFILNTSTISSVYNFGSGTDISILSLPCGTYDYCRTLVMRGGIASIVTRTNATWLVGPVCQYASYPSYFPSALLIFGYHSVGYMNIPLQMYLFVYQNGSTMALSFRQMAIWNDTIYKIRDPSLIPLISTDDYNNLTMLGNESQLLPYESRGIFVLTNIWFGEPEMLVLQYNGTSSRLSYLTYNIFTGSSNLYYLNDSGEMGLSAQNPHSLAIGDKNHILVSMSAGLRAYRTNMTGDIYNMHDLILLGVEPAISSNAKIIVENNVNYYGYATYVDTGGDQYGYVRMTKFDVLHTPGQYAMAQYVKTDMFVLFLNPAEHAVNSLIWLLIVFLPAIVLNTKFPEHGFTIGILIMVSVLGVSQLGFLYITIITYIGVIVTYIKGR